MQDKSAAPNRAEKRAGVSQVSADQLHVERLERGRVAGRADQTADPVALPDQPPGQMTADEPGRPGDQAHVFAGAGNGTAEIRRLAAQRCFARRLLAIADTAMSRTTPQFLLASVSQSASTASSASRKPRASPSLT